MYKLQIIRAVLTLAGSVLSLPHFQTIKPTLDLDRYNNGSHAGITARDSADITSTATSDPAWADLCGPTTFADFTPDFAANSKPNAIADQCLWIAHQMDESPRWERITHHDSDDGVDDWRRLEFRDCCAFKIRMWGGPRKDYFIGSTDIADLIRYSNEHFRYSQSTPDAGGWLTVGRFMDCHPPPGIDGETTNYQWLIGYNLNCNP